MEFHFPDVGEGISEGEIVRWHVSEGDRVEQDETLVEVETDKAIVDIPSPEDGVIESLGRKAGETIEVGDVLLVIDTSRDTGDESEDVIDEDDESSETITLDTSEDDESNSVVGSISTEAEILEGEEAPDVNDDAMATPSTRKLARELGVDLSRVDGSGQDGRITDEDVREAASESVGDEEVSERSGEDEYGDVRIRSISGTRKAIAQRMRASAFEIPQVTHMDQADVTDLHQVVQERRDDLDGDAKLTMLPFFIKAVVNAFQDYPILNATVDKQAEEIIIKEYYNVGVGVDTEHGLMVPVVKDADEKDIPGIAREVTRLSKECRERTIDLDELRGGTFTITNIGFVGGKWATPKINYPEAAIMATGRADKEPAVVDDEIVPRRMLPLSVSFDHRIMDGAEVAEFTNSVKEQLESPVHFDV